MCLKFEWIGENSAFECLCNKAAQIQQLNWLDDPLTMHLSRLMLMMTDHWYSAQNARVELQDQTYQAYANTDNEQKLKQKQ